LVFAALIAEVSVHLPASNCRAESTVIVAAGATAAAVTLAASHARKPTAAVRRRGT
jgi:hypothetical protein